MNPEFVVKHLSANWLKWSFNVSLQTPVEAVMCEDVVELVPAVCKANHSWLHTNSCTDTLTFSNDTIKHTQSAKKHTTLPGTTGCGTLVNQEDHQTVMVGMSVPD